MRGYPIWQTTKSEGQNPGASWQRDILEISATANPSAKAFPRCVFMSERGIAFIKRERDRPFMFCWLAA
jgi:hypothetical protein